MMKLARMTGLALLGAAFALAGCKRSESPGQTPGQTTEPAGSEPPAQSQQRSTPARSTAATPATPTATSVEVPRPAEPSVDWRGLLKQLGAPSLISIQEADGRCEWSVIEPPELEERLFLATHVCPNRVVWDRRGGRSLFELEGVPYLHDWKSSRVEELTPPPLERASFGFASSGAIFACEDEARSDPKGNPSVYRTTLRREEEGSWTRIAYENMGPAAAQVPCSGGVEAERFGEMDYSPSYTEGFECASAERPPDAACPSKVTLDSVTARLLGDTRVRYIAVANENFIAFPAKTGLEQARFAPVLAIDGDTVSEIYNRRPAKPLIRVLLGPDYFLVRAEPEMTHASLFKKGQIEPLKELPEAAVVIWIPGTMPRGEVIEVVPEGSGDEE